MTFIPTTIYKVTEQKIIENLLKTIKADEILKQLPYQIKIFLDVFHIILKVFKLIVVKRYLNIYLYLFKYMLRFLFLVKYVATNIVCW